MKKIFVFLSFFISVNLVSQSVDNFQLSSEYPSLQGQFYVGNYNSDSVEEAKFKFLKWLTYYNAGEDTYIDQISENKIVFTRIIPKGINMRVLKGIEYDMLGEKDLMIRYNIEFKDSRYRLLIDKMGYWEDEFANNSYLKAEGKFGGNGYSLTDLGYHLFQNYSMVSNREPMDLRLRYREPEDMKKKEIEFLNNLISSLNIFKDNVERFENKFYEESSVSVNEFQINDELKEFPGNQFISVPKKIDDKDNFIENIKDWFEMNKKDFGGQKIYSFKDEIFIFGKSYITAIQTSLDTLFYGDLFYWYLTIKINDNSIDFRLNKMLVGNFTRYCGGKYDKTLIEQNNYEFVIDKKIYIYGTMAEVKSCPAIITYDYSISYDALFNKRGKVRKGKFNAANNIITAWNNTFKLFSRNFFEEISDDW
jgi:hypothetical protein